MRIRDGYIIKKLGAGYVVVTVGEASRDFNGMIKLNPAGAFLWGLLEKGPTDENAMVQAMMQRYEDLGEAAAHQDLKEFLDTVSFALED